MTNRSKCGSKKKTDKIFATKDSIGCHINGEASNTLRSGDERRSASSIGFYMTERTQNPQSSYNRYVKNQYASSITNSKSSLKAKTNSTVIQRHLKNRGAKNM